MPTVAVILTRVANSLRSRVLFHIVICVLVGGGGGAPERGTAECGRLPLPHDKANMLVSGCPVGGREACHSFEARHQRRLIVSSRRGTDASARAQ